MIIRNKVVEQSGRCYIVGEMSANHNGSLETALNIVRGLARSGADAVKIQIYEADDLTIDCDKPDFMITSGLWTGKNLYELYQSAITPMDWHKPLMEEAHKLGLGFIASVYNQRTLDMALDLNVDAIKIASFENEWTEFLTEEIAEIDKPVIISLGGLGWSGIEYVNKTFQNSLDIVYLVCSSKYPSGLKDIDFEHIQDIYNIFDVSVGFSDHTCNVYAPLAAKGFGACMIEKHVKLDKSATPDSDFSLTVNEFGQMVRLVRDVEHVPSMFKSSFKRSVRAVKHIMAGDTLTRDNVAVIRPSGGLEPSEFETVVGSRAIVDIPQGTPLKKEMLDKPV